MREFRRRSCQNSPGHLRTMREDRPSVAQGATRRQTFATGLRATLAFEPSPVLVSAATDSVSFTGSQSLLEQSPCNASYPRSGFMRSSRIPGRCLGLHSRWLNVIVQDRFQVARLPRSPDRQQASSDLRRRAAYMIRQVVRREGLHPWNKSEGRRHRSSSSR